MSDALNLPVVLKPKAAELVEALQAVVPIAWDDENDFLKAEQPAAIAKVIRPICHEVLGNARIAWLFKKKLGKGCGANIRLASGPLGYLAKVDIVCVVSWEAWRGMSERARLALVDHELCHCAREDDNLVMVEHDIEEFHAIAERWGPWHIGLHRFKNAIKGVQGELFISGPKEATS